MPTSQLHAEMSDRFQATHWSMLVLAADSQAPGAQAALETWCREYWVPIRGYVSSRGFSEPDAEDLTQSFLLSLITSKSLRRVDPARGRFRAFLLAALKNFLADEWSRRHAAKRGGGQRPISIDEQPAGSRVPLELSSEAAGEAVFDKQWALTVVGRATADLRRRWELLGKSSIFAALEIYLAGNEPAEGYGETAAQLGLSPAAVKTHIHRLRTDYRAILRQEVAQTVSAPSEINAELRYLCQALVS